MLEIKLRFRLLFTFLAISSALFRIKNCLVPKAFLLLIFQLLRFAFPRSRSVNLSLEICHVMLLILWWINTRSYFFSLFPSRLVIIRISIDRADSCTAYIMFILIVWIPLSFKSRPPNSCERLYVCFLLSLFFLFAKELLHKTLHLLINILLEFLRWCPISLSSSNETIEENS